MILNTSILKQILVALGGDPEYGDNSVATERKIVNAVGGYGDDHGDNEAALLKRWLLQIGGTPVYSDNEDKTLGKILEQYGGGLGFFLNPSGKLNAILSQINAVPVAPTVVSATILANGETIEIVFSEPMNGTSGFSELAAEYTITYVSGEGTNTYTFSLSPITASMSIVSATYTPGDLVGINSGLPLAAIADLPLTNNSVMDPDAIDFIGRASLTNPTHKSATNTLVLDLKDESLWDEMVALYPFVGGTSLAHSKNLKGDIYNITWVNSPTHNANGVTGDGVAAYGICNGLTLLTPSPRLSGMTAYVRSMSAPATFSRYAGALSNDGITATQYYILDFRDYGGGSSYNVGCLGELDSFIQPLGAAASGTVSINRTASNEEAFYINGVSVGTNSFNDTSVPVAVNIYLLAANEYDTPNSISNANLAFFAAHNGLTAGQVATLSTLIHNFQTALGRNV